MYEFLVGSHYKFYLWYLVGSLVDLSGYIGKHWLHMLDVGMWNCSWPHQDSALLWPLCHTPPLTPVRHNWQAVPWDLSLPHTVPDLCLQTFHFTFQVTVSSCRRDFPRPPTGCKWTWAHIPGCHTYYAAICTQNAGAWNIWAVCDSNPLDHVPSLSHVASSWRQASELELFLTNRMSRGLCIYVPTSLHSLFSLPIHRRVRGLEVRAKQREEENTNGHGGG